MLDKAEEILVLFSKHLRGELSNAEKKTLDELLQSSGDIQRMFNKMNSEEEFMRKIEKYYTKASNISDDEVRRVFNRTIEPAKVVPMHEPKRAYLKWVAAAAIIFIVGFGVYFWQNNKQLPIAIKDEEKQPPQQEIMPANGFAILVLDDGRKVVLDSAGNGVIASNGGKEIIKQEGQLSYQGQSKEVVYNTLVTSKGKMMNLQLADGSRVWLNAESSIRFPTEFPGNERIVEVTGEVNFEVTKNIKKPFRVIIQTPAGQKAEVEVLGTHFNVNAYSEEATIQTTLIEGSVKVSELTNDATRILVPGQQATIDKTGNVAVLINVNTDAVVAWKERNFFHFRNNDITTIMRQLARWYDISVKYEGNSPERTFSGQVSRELSLSAVLNMLEQANVRFSTNGREVTVKE